MHLMHICIYIVNRTNNYVGRTVSSRKDARLQNKIANLKSNSNPNADQEFKALSAKRNTFGLLYKCLGSRLKKYIHNVSMSGNVCVGIVIVFQMENW